MENNAPHIHSFKDINVPSTCKERGYTLHKCECGYERKDNFQPLSGHSFKLVEEIKSDCTNDGSQKVVCSVCGQEIVTTIPSPGHRFGAWNVIEFAACTQDGVQERYCGVCGAKEMQAIPATGHKLTKPVKSQTNKGKYECYCENCGETFEKKPKAKKIIITVIILLLVAVAGVFASIKFVIPHYHYTTAKKLLEEGNYAASYSHFYKCMDYKDSKRFMYNFCFADQEWSSQWYKDGEVKSKYTSKDQYVYNENGYVIKQTYYSDNGEKTIYQNEWEFYENGKPKSNSHYQDGKLSQKQEYNSQGHSILWCLYYSDEEYTLMTSEYKYYDNGEIRERIDYDEDGKEQSRYIYKYEYDDSGNLLSETAEGTNKGEYTKTKYEYDINGIPLKYTEYDKNGKETGKNIFKIEFTENGYEYTVTEYDEDVNKEHKYSFVYTNPVSYRED